MVWGWWNESGAEGERDGEGLSYNIGSIVVGWETVQAVKQGIVVAGIDKM